MSESLVIDFLYKTRFGRFMLKGLVNPAVSKLAAGFLSLGASRCIIPAFIRQNGIDMEKYIVPEGGYKSFNDFFSRRIKPNRRVIGQGEIICPCDGLLTVSRIGEDSVFLIKNTAYSIKSLLRNESAEKYYIGGTALIFRLTPAHYHRYVFCTSGKAWAFHRIDGKLHSVKPVCHENLPVFIENSREYTVIDNTTLGKVVQMEVGALLVGKISNTPFPKGRYIHTGEEKGFFEYGGSSIVVLTKNRIELNETLSLRAKLQGEIPVKLGEDIF